MKVDELHQMQKLSYWDWAALNNSCHFWGSLSGPSPYIGFDIFSAKEDRTLCQVSKYGNSVPKKMMNQNKMLDRVNKRANTFVNLEKKKKEYLCEVSF